MAVGAGVRGQGSPRKGAGRASDDRSDKPSLRGGVERFPQDRDRRERSRGKREREPQRVIGRARRRSVRPMTRWYLATVPRNISGL